MDVNVVSFFVVVDVAAAAASPNEVLKSERLDRAARLTLAKYHHLRYWVRCACMCCKPGMCGKCTYALRWCSVEQLLTASTRYTSLGCPRMSSLFVPLSVRFSQRLPSRCFDGWPAKRAEAGATTGHCHSCLGSSSRLYLVGVPTRITQNMLAHIEEPTLPRLRRCLRTSEGASGVRM